MVHEHRYIRDIRYGPKGLDMDGSGKNPMETVQLDTLLCKHNISNTTTIDDHTTETYLLQ